MRYLSNAQVRELLSMQECIDEMDKLFRLDFESDIVCPLRTKVEVSEAGLIGLMPCSIKPFNVAGVKIITVFPGNYQQKMSSHQGVIHLIDASNGSLLISMDAEAITEIRTAAVSALMTRQMASEDAKCLCLLGTGRQADSHLEAMMLVRDIKRVKVWGKDRVRREEFVERQSRRYRAELIACHSAEEAVTDADIVCTLTSSRLPILFNDWLKESVHINAVGASTPTARELDTEVVLSSFVVVDNYTSALNEAGDILQACNGTRNAESIIAMSGFDFIKSTTDVKNQKSIFKSVGFAAEDVVAANYCFQKMIGESIH